MCFQRLVEPQELPAYRLMLASAGRASIRREDRLQATEYLWRGRDGEVAPVRRGRWSVEAD